MKLVGYLRVSTDRQAEHGLGLVVQETAIRKWAKANGHRLVMVCRDEGLSGSNGIETRIGLHDALQAIQTGRADGIVVYKLDRLARSLSIQEGVLAQCWKHHGTVFAVDMGVIHADDADDPMRTALRQMVGVFAQLERGMIAARMRAGRAMKAAQGGYAYGAPGFGVVATSGQLVADPVESATVRRIMELHAAGMSTRKIVDLLHAENRPPKRGDKWYSATVATVIKRRLGQS